jgi:molybdopterin-guanine dinucleotide biosynthesis protein A
MKGYAGLVLAGGLGRRMGGVDKGLVTLAGQTLLARTIAILKPQVETLAINANGDPQRFAEFHLPVLADSVPGFAGPLAGILAGLEWLERAVPAACFLVTVPCDTPFLPANLVAHLAKTAGDEGSLLACAESDHRLHPVIGLWPVGITKALRKALVEEDIRKIDRFTQRYRVASADFPAKPIDPFLNVNTPDDIANAEALLESSS